MEIDGIKVDYYDAKKKVIHEIKKSNKVDKAHEWQLKYYMYVFEQHGIDGVKGILEYPLLRKTKEVIYFNTINLHFLILWCTLRITWFMHQLSFIDQVWLLFHVDAIGKQP